MAQFSTLKNTFARFVFLLLAGSVIAAGPTERRNPGTDSLAECFFNEVPNFKDGAKPSIPVIKKCMESLNHKRSIYRRGAEVGGATPEEEDLVATDYIIDGGEKNHVVD
ncbi:hypothetical protein K458DRAFT_429989 [Lentithecium fluviatile CBS 122367]|uniref:Uncharacterized protein n=1 Tax=Lentithecium fluviatile CBS 122367 TaxID=1168545 RepID=A0A6G1J6D9_9PLEO|nr:hypothetical protein K458DRAFT_429989 [Lentithecium fluviatile CBS 122367]